MPDIMPLGWLVGAAFFWRFCLPLIWVIMTAETKKCNNNKNTPMWSVSSFQNEPKKRHVFVCHLAELWAGCCRGFQLKRDVLVLTSVHFTIKTVMYIS